jgi:hypothetical protein
MPGFRFDGNAACGGGARRASRRHGHAVDADGGQEKTLLGVATMLNMVELLQDAGHCDRLRDLQRAVDACRARSTHYVVSALLPEAIFG